MACRTALFLNVSIPHIRTNNRLGLGLESHPVPSKRVCRNALDAVQDRRRANVLDLRSVTTTGDTDADVELGELVEADDEERLVDLSCEKQRQHFRPSLTANTKKSIHPSIPMPQSLFVVAPKWVRPSYGASVVGLLFGGKSLHISKSRTLVRRMAGSTSWRGRPLTLMRPLPALH